MAVFATATFTGTNGTALQTADTNFTRHPSYTANCVIDTNECKGDSASTTAYYHSGSPVGASYKVSATLHKVAQTSGFPGVCGRISTSTNTFYLARWNEGESGWQLYKFVNGTATQLGSTVTDTFTAGSSHNITLEMDAAAQTVKLFKKGESTAAITASSETSITDAGKSGLRILGTDIRLDNFSAEDLSGGGTSVSSDLALKWDMLNVIASDLALKWDIFATTASDLTLLWDIRDNELTSVSSDLALAWDTFAPVSSDLSLNWDALQQVFSDLAVKWDVYQTVSGDLTILFDVRNLVESDLALIWDAVGRVSSNLTLRWDLGDNFGRVTIIGSSFRRFIG